MNLLGPYPSQLTSFYYQGLLAILQQAISSGEYAGGTLFDSSAANNLQAEGSSFAELPVINAGTRAAADQFNTPLATLQARFNALLSESTNFQTTLASLLTVIDKDSSLVEQALAATLGNAWVQEQPIVTDSLPFSWDFAAGYGSTANSIAPIDPLSGVKYPTVCPTDSIAGDGEILSGLVTPFTSQQLAVKNLVWNYNFAGQTEILSGDNWTQFSYLAPGPLLIYSVPQLNLLLPNGQGVQTITALFIITGQGTAGNLPIYVQISFIPRSSQIDFIAAETSTGGPLQLSVYRVDPASIVVYDSTQTFNLATDYTLDENNNVVPNPIMTSDGVTTGCQGLPISIQFSEYYPAYQCSTNQNDWSVPVMLDPDRLFPDTATTFTPVPVQVINGFTQFPITDELGNPLGFYLTRQVDANGNPIVPNSNMLFTVTSPVATAAGAQAELVVELEQPTYLTGFYLEPFTSFAMTLSSVYLEGFNSSSLTPILSNPLPLLRATKITFPATLTRKVHLNFTQENYTLEEVTVQPPDALRRTTLNNLQGVIPFNVFPTTVPKPVTYEGAEYDFGIQNMYAEYANHTAPGIFVAGPFNIAGQPEIVRLDVAYSGMMSAYLIYNAYDGNGNLIDTAEIEMLDVSMGPSSGDTIVYPSSVTAASVDFYIKFVLRDPSTMIERYLLQVTLVQ